MTWIIFSAMALIFTVAYGVISKMVLNKRQENLNPVALASAMFIFVGVVTFFISLFQGRIGSDLKSLFDPNIFPLLIINLVAYTIAPSFYYRGLKNLPLSLVIIIYSVSGLLALIIELILGLSPFHFTYLAGSVFIISSIILVTYKRRDFKNWRYIPYVFIATFFYAFAGVLDKQLLTHFSNFFYLALTFGLPGVMIIFANLLSFEKVIKPYLKQNYPAVVVYGLFASASFYCVFNAYRLGGTTTQVYSFLALESLITVVAAAMFLKERKQLALKMFAAVLAGIGIYLLTL